MLKWQQIRFSLLAVIASASLVVLAKSIFDPNLGKPTPYAFPETLDIANWVPVNPSTAITDKEITDPNSALKVSYKVGRRYQYAIDRQSIKIDVRYLVRTSGNVVAFLQDYAEIQLKPEELQKGIRHQEGLGYYTLFTYQNRVYLSACINPRGQSTVTVEQFDDNMTAYALKPSTIVSWLLAQADLRDRRCLWSQFSADLEGDSAENIEQKLTKAWISWHEWWKARFPLS
ncbi:cyanoexosortase A system-associated protein [Tumidithrix elongata RA019]|uniref:Cyanoexosortase A system-associated protein n=1 Tax=Tumidithrix elongata BACA0141 TaxID=2716417 RepID=A0AAW9PTL4_9CYAN|nr:cyanoexosortase A system-associated protein [Tumidithrix elongata RA019]